MRGVPTKWWPLVLAAVLSAVVLVAGCGGDDDGGGASGETSTAEWADGVCTALSNWTTSMTSVASSLGEAGLNEQGIEDVINEVKSATQTLVDDLQDLGRPDTEAGQEAQESLDKLADDLQQDIDEIENAVGDASGAAGAAQALQTMSTTLSSMGTAVGTTLSGLESLDAEGELREAFEDADSCQELAEAGS